MSGLFLIVWEDVDDEKDRVLHATKGGYPHITDFYSGKNLTREVLLLFAEVAMRQLALMTIELVSAEVSEFEKDGKMQYYVLLNLDPEGNKIMKAHRDHLLDPFPMDVSFLTMRDPHVTYKTCETREEADQWVKFAKETVLPLTVTITGVTID
jgi:hypothetical protein